MTLRKKLAAAVLISTLTFAGAASSDDACLLNAGCYLVSGGDSSPPY